MGKPPERIGDPTKEKWSEFLARCLEKGILGMEEYADRMGRLWESRTSGETRETYKDLPWEPWSDAWNEQREKGLRSAWEILPDIPRARKGDPGWIWVAAIGWALAIALLVIICILGGKLSSRGPYSRGSYNVSQETGTCPSCGKIMSIRKDGNFRRHGNREGAACPGNPYDNIRAGVTEGLIREILEAVCVRDGISLDSSAAPGQPARNYELALRLHIGHVFGLPDE